MGERSRKKVKKLETNERVREKLLKERESERETNDASVSASWARGALVLPSRSCSVWVLAGVDSEWGGLYGSGCSDCCGGKPAGRSE